MIITLEMLAPTGSRSCIPSFVKLAKRNDKETLKAGTYRLKIFDLTISRKRILLPRRIAGSSN
jgi:hypothetical protein